jgi:hypothetical protein
LLLHPALCFAQSEAASLAGVINDPKGALVPGAEVTAKRTETNTAITTKTNGSGVFAFPSLQPGHYRVQVRATGFKEIVLKDVELHVQDKLQQNFSLEVGSVSETVNVEGGIEPINTQDATVSTVVDRQFAENLPMNGRSFQTLIQLTPGVVLTTSSGSDSGQFSVNGQRAVSNYWMVDGVSANIGVGVNTSALPGNGLGGTLGSFSAQGGTNSLVSVDAMQEFRIQTSTYAPEFGRTPGGQISIVTRSGTNQFHGSAFDYLRNDLLDANDWFADQNGLPKPEERQNDFGGTLSGPILKNRMFFFFSYEGLRLRLPQVGITTVPDASFTPGGTTDSRDNAIPAMQPYLKAFPLPKANSPEIFSGGTATGSAAFDASYSNSSTLDAYSLRVDHKLSDRVTLFGRYNYSPSEIVQRGTNGSSLSTVSPTRITTQTATAGAVWTISPTVTNDLRFNYSHVNARGYSYLDNFGGAVPLASLPFPSPFTSQNASLLLFITSLSLTTVGGSLAVGPQAGTLQRQINVVDSLSMQRGSHSLKFGVDFRRLSPKFAPSVYGQTVQFGDLPSAENGNLSFDIVTSSLNPTFLLRDLGLYAQDTWRVLPRLTVTYGLRWDVGFVPRTLEGPEFPATTGFNVNDLSTLALAPDGTPPYSTTYRNFAPRVGVAYQVLQNRDWQTVLRGGFGMFYDLATSEAGNSLGTGSYPFGAGNFCPNPSNPACPSGNLTFPLASATAAPPVIAPPSANNPGVLFAFDPHLQTPYTLEWNVAIEQAFGSRQTISASYVGAAGRRLLQTASESGFPPPNPNFLALQLVTNAGTSDYNALEVQFQRRLSQGLQALASYTWAHSIDTASAGSAGVSGNLLGPSSIANQNRGPSDFDIRNTFSAALTYDIPAPKINAFANAILHGWSVENIILARSAPPVDVQDASPSFFFFNNIYLADIRPDLVPGQPLYLYGSQCLQPPPLPLGCPGGRGINPNAFQDPPTDPNTGAPLRQGNVPRNFLRGFGAAQWNFAVHREFPIHESLKVQFRAEMFNILNHPNFGPPFARFLTGGYPGFGIPSQMLGQSLNNMNQGGGGFSSLYQMGGPRSIQVALKLTF